MTDVASHSIVIYFILLCPRMFLLELTYLPFWLSFPKVVMLLSAVETLANRRWKKRRERRRNKLHSEGHGEPYSWRILSWVTELQISKVFDFEPLIFLGYWTEIHYWFSYKKVVLSHYTNSENKSFLQKIRIFLSTATNRLSKLGFYLDFARLGCINSIMGLLRYKIDC